MAGPTPDPSVYKGVEETRVFIERVFSFMRDLEVEYGGKNANIFISGHRCTTGCIGAYFNGILDDGNILRFSSGNGEYKVYSFKGK